jgi:multidrug efflux pump subunit AcrA (membrane-fusion protein)
MGNSQSQQQLDETKSQLAAEKKRSAQLADEKAQLSASLAREQQKLAEQQRAHDEALESSRQEVQQKQEALAYAMKRQEIAEGLRRSDALLADLDELEQERAICLALLGGEIRLDLRRLALALVGLALGGGDCRLLVNCVALGRLHGREPFLTHLERRTRLAHLVGELAVQAVGTEL